MVAAIRSRSIILISLILVMLISTVTALGQPGDGFQMVHTGYGLSLHKEMFMLPVTFSDEYHGAQTEAVFQISAKHSLGDTRFYFAYTQISFWQAYDHRNSAPFRETNYNPELFYRFKTLPFHSGNLGVDMGFEHESNGQRPPVSRSWNLAYVCPYYETSNLLIYTKFRYRFPEDDKEYPGAAVGDDNPDITDYLGHADLHVYFKPWHNHQIRLWVRGNLSKGRGGVVLNYSFMVPKSKRSFVGIRVSQGYGESMVDYKKSLTRIGVGVMFTR